MFGSSSPGGVVTTPAQQMTLSSHDIGVSTVRFIAGIYKPHTLVLETRDDFTNHIANSKGQSIV